MQKSVIISLVGVILVLLLTSSALAVSGEFTGSTSLKYTGTSSDPGFFYQDGVGGASGNVDVGIELCDVGQRYVGGVYALQVGALWYYSLVTYSSSSNALAYTSVDEGGGCYSAPEGFVTVSPSALSTPNPDVERAALPGNLWIGYAVSANPGSISDFVYSLEQAKLLGDYTVSRSFDQSTRQVSVQTPTISFTSTSGSFSESASDGTHGISSDRRMVIGLCDDTYGNTCSDGTLLTSATFPQVFSSGLSAGEVDDQQTHTKYVVMNGIGKSICIGANLEVSVDSISPDPIYYSQTLEINFTIVNDRDSPYELLGGNVDVTTPFDITVTIYETGNSANIIYTDTTEVSASIVPDGTYSVTANWPAIAQSGDYTVEVEVDVNSEIEECVEGDNSATGTFELLPVTIPTIYIDGIQTDTFDHPHAPYNLSFHLENSDGDTLRNATILLTETNGLSLSMPTQIYNLTTGSNTTQQQGIITSTQARFFTDYYGNATLLFIPTYHPFYTSTYSYVGLEDYIGNYSLHFNGSQSNGEAFKFVSNGTLYSIYDFDINDTEYNGTYAAKSLYQESFVSQVLDFMYHAYANFLETVLG